MGLDMETLEKNQLSAIVSQLGKIDFAQHKRILPLPNDQVFVIDIRDNIVITDGFGHEPEMLNKMLEFTREGEVYVEVGANYGDFALQMSKYLGSNAKVYTFEPGKDVFESFLMSIFLNSATNIKAEHLAILDRKTEVSFFETIGGSLGSNIVANESIGTTKVKATSLDRYFQNKESRIDILRVDAEGSECKVLKGASNIIDSSPDIRIFIEWQYPLLRKYESLETITECLSNLVNKGFIFLDILQFNNKCDYTTYKLSEKDVLMSNPLDFLAIRESILEKIIAKNSIYITNKECIQSIDRLLFDAASTGMIDRVKKLLGQGANIEYIHNHGKALSMSAQNGHTEIVDHLLQAGAKIDPDSILYLPAQNGYFEIVELLLNAGADPNNRAINELTPLFVAVQEKHFEVIKLLLEHGANPEIKATNGLTPLYMSVQYKEYSILRMLLEYQADPENALPNGATPLYYASYYGDIYSVALLLKHGASKSATVEGMDVMQAGNKDIVELLSLGLENYCQQIPRIEENIELIGICEE